MGFLTGKTAIITGGGRAVLSDGSCGSIGYGIATAMVGVILTCTRILDGVTDPMLAFLYDRVETKFGKIPI